MSKLKDINEHIVKLDGIDPIFEFEQPKAEVGLVVNEALARAFSIEQFRNYLKNTINKQIYYAATKSEDENQMWLNRGRITALKELYRNMERAYSTLPK